MTGDVGHYVLHDRSVPACLKVSRALRLPLWGRDSTPLAPHERLVVVVARASQVHEVLEAVRQGTGRPPALVVAWALPERHLAALLTAGIPTVDGSVISDPSAADDALAGWDEARLMAELALAEALAEMEPHLRETKEVTA